MTTPPGVLVNFVTFKVSQVVVISGWERWSRCSYRIWYYVELTIFYFCFVIFFEIKRTVRKTRKLKKMKPTKTFTPLVSSHT